MILNYCVNDGLGNMVTIMVQGESRAECDRLLRQELARTEGIHGIDAGQLYEVTDITRQTILRSVYYNHETGEDMVL